MASFDDDQQRTDREAWDAAVKLILGDIPERTMEEGVERLAAALSSVSTLMRRLSPETTLKRSSAA